MDARTLEALKASIAKWERNAAVKTPSEYRTHYKDCTLCDLFHDANCEGCPVEARTGVRYCDETPYGNAWSAANKWKVAKRGERSAAKDTAHSAARDEVAFLKSLLPSDEAAS